ncbi:hypothetical protein INR49_005941 [Caranx melampygus]|nr:hypothetical protein INR49_005941 [Caranx melampygus]
MKNPGAAESRRLVGLLETALVREARLWKVPVFKNGCIQGADISSSQHKEMIVWLGEMSRTFHFCPETFALGVCVLNRLLSTVKAHQKYLKCIAFTSLVLAAKINEEDEVVGSVKDLVVLSGCNFSTREIFRMERIILDKLNWDLLTATAVDFIHIVVIHFTARTIRHGQDHYDSSGKWGRKEGGGALLVKPDVPRLARLRPPPPRSVHRAQLRPRPRGASRRAGAQKTPPGFQAALWTRQVQHCMACHQLWQFKGSTLALAIITLELEALTPDWFSVFTDLLKKAQVDSAEFIHCKEMVDEYLSSLEFSLPPNAVYIFDSAQIQDEEDEDEEEEEEKGRGRGRRRAGSSSGVGGGGGGEQGDSDEYYDGFWCLYNEQTTPREEGSDVKGLFDSQHKDASPCPPLHPIDG